MNAKGVSTTTTTNNNNNNISSHSSHNIFDFLECLPASYLSRLYGDGTRGPYACKAVLQHLPELAQQFIVRLVVCGGEFGLKEVKMWCSPSGSRDAELALRRMEALHMIDPLKSIGRNSEDDDDDDVEEDRRKQSNGNETIQLKPEFLKGIRVCMSCLESAPWPAVSKVQQEELKASFAANEKNEKKPGKKYPPPPTPDQLEMYTQKRWDSVLHFLVGSDGEEDPPRAVITFLEKTGLMQEDPDYAKSSSNNGSPPPLVITSKGYEFMLQDVHVQVWQFILQYFHSLSQHPKCEQIVTEALLFLISLSYCRVGAPYPASLLSKDSRILMKDFSQFGILYVCKIGSATVFYPTRVAINLVAAGTSSPHSGSSSSSIAPSASATKALETSLSAPIPSSSHIAIIVQTNFQLCAYTTSQLHVSMLGLFCDVSTYRRLPNVIFFKITRESIKAAFRLGIEAQQILTFLKMHAHPRLRTGEHPLMPENVEDQILLWDRERNRVVLQEVWCHQCQSPQEFEGVQRYAMDTDAFAWASEVKHKIMIRYEKAENVMGFVRRWRARQTQRQQQQQVGSLGPLRRANRQTSYT